MTTDDKHINADEIARLYRQYQHQRDITPADTLQTLREASQTQSNESAVHELLQLAKAMIYAKAKNLTEGQQAYSADAKAEQGHLTGRVHAWFTSLLQPKVAGPAMAAVMLAVVSIFLFPQGQAPRYAYLSDCSACAEQFQAASAGFRSSGVTSVSNTIRNAARAGSLAASLSMLGDQSQPPTATVSNLQTRLQALTNTLSKADTRSDLSPQQAEQEWLLSNQAEVYKVAKASTTAAMSALAYTTLHTDDSLAVWQEDHQRLLGHLLTSQSKPFNELLIGADLRALEPSNENTDRITQLYRRLDSSLGLP